MTNQQLARREKLRKVMNCYILTENQTLSTLTQFVDYAFIYKLKQLGYLMNNGRLLRWVNREFLSNVERNSEFIILRGWDGISKLPKLGEPKLLQEFTNQELMNELLRRLC